MTGTVEQSLAAADSRRRCSGGMDPALSEFLSAADTVLCIAFGSTSVQHRRHIPTVLSRSARKAHSVAAFTVLNAPCTKTLTACTLRDKKNAPYTFGSFKLKAGASVKVYSGKGTNTASKRYIGRNWHLWNHSGGDTATLKSASGAKVDTCSRGRKLVESYKDC